MTSPRRRTALALVTCLLTVASVSGQAPISRLLGLVSGGSSSPGTSITGGSSGFLVWSSGGMSLNGGTFSGIVIGGSNAKITMSSCEFVEVDPLTGTSTLLNTLPNIWSVWLGRSGVDLVQRVFYFVGDSNALGSGRLIGLDVDNGSVVSNIGLSFPTMASGRLVAMEFDSAAGVLYGIALDPGSDFVLATIDPVTGIVTPTTTTFAGPVRLGVSGLDESGGPTFFVETQDALAALNPTIPGPVTAGPPVNPPPLGISYDNLNDRVIAYGNNQVMALNTAGVVTSGLAVTNGLTAIHPGSFDFDRGSGTYFFSAMNTNWNQEFQVVDTGAASVTTVLPPTPLRFACARFIDDTALLPICGAGNVGTWTGMPAQDVMLVNGSSGATTGRLVTVGVNQPLTLDILQPTTQATPATFAILGQLLLPNFQTLYTTPLGYACITPALFNPNDPNLFTVADCIGWGLNALFPAGSPQAPVSAPWTLSLPSGIGAPFVMTLQGVIQDGSPAFGLALTNTVGVVVQ
ncbi:MAG: hypothetical protein VX913_16425 [Planctomycetota bacterium]|nr:hypothetical protein [Planctomycetota bacterium]